MTTFPVEHAARCVVSVDPRTDERWATLSAQGSLFTSPPWISAVCGTYDFVPAAGLVLDDGGSVLAGVARVELSDLRGDRIVSLPFSDRADPLGDPGCWTVLADSGTAAAPWTLRCFDDAAAAADPRMDTIGTVAWHGTPLDCGLDELRARLSGTARRNLGSGVKAGVRVEMRTDLAAVREFHRLHVVLRKRKYHMLAQSAEFFERIHDEFAASDSFVVMLARIDGEVVAGAVFLEWGDTLYYKFGASDPDHLRSRPNDAVYWAGITWATERGLHEIDWGISDLDQPGLIAFKDKWATRRRRVVTLRAGLPVTAPDASLLGELTALLVDPSVPDEITARAGALLYRYFG